MNKIERLNAVLNGEKPDIVPAGFWYHYDPTNNTYTIAQNHLRTFRETGVDVYKVMQDYIQPIEVNIQSAADWDKVSYPGTSSPVYQRLLDVIKMILTQLVMTRSYSRRCSARSKPSCRATAMTWSWLTQDRSAAARRGRAPRGGSPDRVGNGLHRSRRRRSFSTPASSANRDASRTRSSTCSSRRATSPSCARQRARGARNILHICGEPDYNYVSTPPATPNTPVLSPTGPSRTPASPSPRAESSSAASPFSAA